MSACQQFAESAATGIAPALRAVDCLANETAAITFARLFGGAGSQAPVLTLVLTLYIGFFAISLLTGRSRIGIAALTPRMITLGLVLTFATSWLAYQSVVWNLAVGGPDQIASILTGTTGSATQIFADRMDTIFAAIADVASESGQGAQGAGEGAVSGNFTPANVMWLGALILLLGTVGVLVTARIALAVLLAIGPVFVVFALFNGTRGLTAGWLRSVVLTAITPLFVVVGGSIVLELLVPIISSLRSPDGPLDGRAAMALFLAATVHLTLIVLTTKVTATIVSAWQVFGLARQAPENAGIDPARMSIAMAAPVSAQPTSSSRTAMTAAGLQSAAFMAPDNSRSTSGNSTSMHTSRTIVTQESGSTARSLSAAAPRRARGLGSRFQSKPSKSREML